MEDRIATIIRDWLTETFGNPDALPNLILKGLAEEINKHRWEIYKFVKDENDLEDIATVATDKAIELTDEEARIVLRKYQDSEYQDVDTLTYLIDRIIEIREEAVK